ncbi:MAG TPA: hypothetical protein VND96_05680 [Candidatus Micrarchaeaceae archaeon]|nr:hypothetical protein [Candidatus Micrarchaeaceae archaeon]
MTDEVAIIGSFVVIAALLSVVVLATGTYRKSMAFAAAAITAKPGEPFELICGIRLGRWGAATWPAGRFKLTDEGVSFNCFGLGARAAWVDVKLVGLVKPLNQLGWGVRFSIRNRQPDSVIVWLNSRMLAERVIEACDVHGVPTERKPRVAL